MSKKQFRGFKNIILTTDFSDRADNASPYAFSMAKHYDATLHIVHVVDTSSGEEGFDIRHLDKEKMCSAERMLNKIFYKRLHRLSKHKTVVLKGISDEAIIDYAKKIKADLVIMSTQGRSGLDRFIFGSTTDRVMRKVHCPVLTIHPESS